MVGKKSITITLNDKSKSEKYYVYGMGELVAIYDKAAYAIQRAEQISGVVISSEQAYVWEKRQQRCWFMIQRQHRLEMEKERPLFRPVKR